MSSRKRKSTTTKNPSLVLAPTPESNPIPSLPKDLMLSCLARVPRSYYPYLSLVSKSFRSLLASPELYETRSLLRRTESCLYVSLRLATDPHPRLFTLYRKPDRTLANQISKSKKKSKKKKSSGSLLVPIPSPCCPITRWSCLVAVSSNIYKIGGPIDQDLYLPSTSVSVLDCRSHTWREALSLLVERRFSAALVVDGKIYVEGDDIDSRGSIEVFDLKTQTWDHVPMLNCEVRTRRHWACIDDKFHLILEKISHAYDPKESRWDMIEGEIDWDGVLSRLDRKPYWSYCWIENVLYCYFDHIREFKWYDTKVRMWKNLKGLVGLPTFARFAQVSLADYGGKMAVLWDKGSLSIGYKKTIWCAEIALERRGGDDEIWGKVEWLDGVLPVPDSYEVVSLLAATL